MIDLLSQYDWWKVVENKCKTLVLAKQQFSISAIRPDQYAARFLNFIQLLVFARANNHPSVCHLVTRGEKRSNLMIAAGSNMELPREVKEKARGRQQFKQGDQVIYEWEQNLDEVLVYFKPPPWALPKNRAEMQRNLQPGQKLPLLEVIIERDHLRVGVNGNPPFLNSDLGGSVIKDESMWFIEDEELVVNLQKMRKAETWTEVFRGHQKLDPLTQNEVQKKILLERFQEEHPGFDFSGAEFNGMVPDARKFMGGVSYK